jgi:exodeoxyribonuclease V alpha subunit
MTYLPAPFEFTSQFISERTKDFVQAAPSAVQRARLGIDRIEIACRVGHIIERTHRLIVTPRNIRNGWNDGRRTAKILEADAEIIPFEPQLLGRAEGVPLADTRALAKRFGPDWPGVIAANPAVLNQTKFSPDKRKLIADACKRDFEADKKVKRGRALIAQLCAAGIPKAKARGLAEQYEPDAGPYQFCLAGKMGLIHADRFASIASPGGHKDRALAIVMSSFADCDDTICSRGEIAEQTWLNHALDENETRAAIDALLQREYLKQHDDYFGPAAVFEAEEFLAEFVKDNPRIELTSRERKIVETIIAEPAKFLNIPGFILDDQQAAGIRQCFDYRASILCGPPGSGKTAIVALINVIAHSLWKDPETPIYGVALAGRAASNLRSAATVDHGDCAAPMAASTIHSAWKIKHGAADDDFEAGATLETGALIVEESSMLSSRIMAAILRNADARRILFVGDEAQLPPIKAGKPFKDWIKHDALPIVRLERNYRTGWQGIRGICDGIRKGCGHPLEKDFASLLAAGGCEYIACNPDEEAEIAAGVFKETAFTKAGRLRKGWSLDDVAVLSPLKGGDAGVRRINDAIRVALGFAADTISPGEILLCTRNNYEVPSADGPQEIYNGERAAVHAIGKDYLDLDFLDARRVRLLMRDAASNFASGKLPENFEFGYAMTVHKAQGSQFRAVIAPLAKTYRNVGIIQRSAVYTQLSRAREKLVLIGDARRLFEAAEIGEKLRRTLLERLLRGESETPSASDEWPEF